MAAGVLLGDGLLIGGVVGRYGVGARDCEYRPDAEEDAYAGTNDGFSRKGHEICEQLMSA